MLFPDARAAVEHAAAETPVWTPGYDVAGARREARELAAAQPREQVEQVHEVDADGVRCRLYVPAGATPGVVVHAHGGGFVFNDVEVHDAACRRLANRSRRRVLSVDYRLAPEHPFPAARDDLDTVLAWLESPAATALSVAGPLALHGDSAGANLALVAALRHPGRCTALALVYPFLDPTAALPSHRSESQGFGPEEVAWYWEQYAAGDPTRFEDPDLAPLLAAGLGGLPPTLVVTAEHDPLRDEGEQLARLIAEQGGRVVAVRALGQVHGFWRHEDVFAAAEPIARQAAAFVAAG